MPRGRLGQHGNSHLTRHRRGSRFGLPTPVRIQYSNSSKRLRRSQGALVALDRISSKLAVFFGVFRSMFLVLPHPRRSARRLFNGLAALLLLGSFLSAEQPASKYPPTVVFMTDFGTADDSVA